VIIFLVRPSILSAKRANEKFYFDVPREDSVLSSKDSYLELDFYVLCEDDNEKFLVADNTRSLKLKSNCFI